MLKRKIARVLLVVAVVAAIMVVVAVVANKPAKEVNVQDQAYQFFTEKGFGPVQTCGIMATIKWHSRFETDEKAEPNGLGYGLMSWLPKRREKLEHFATEIGEPVDSAETQLMFMMEELKVFWKNTGEDYEWEDFLNATDPGVAAEIFCRGYCAPQCIQGDGFRESLGKVAEKFYEHYTYAD